MLNMTPKGLYCPAGDFYIDPKGAVTHAIVTHAHSDHARRGSKHYYCVKQGVGVLKTRLGSNIDVKTYNYGESFNFKDVGVSFHPAGHILGSSQIRLVFCGEVWVVSGDYKRDYDPTCEAFETIPCDVFITEATFGKPAYQWDKQIDYGAMIAQWWHQNAQQGYHSVLYAYSLGKAQRILASLKNYADKPIYCQPVISKMNQCYQQQGIILPSYYCLSATEHEPITQGLSIVTPGFFKTQEAWKLGPKFRTAFASGWQAHGNYRHHGGSSGFVLSDHADWDDLMTTILATKAKRVFIQHPAPALIKTLRHHHIDAHYDTKLAVKNPQQLAFF